MSAPSLLRRIGVKFVDYWKQVGADYGTVIRESAEEGKRKPWKPVLSAVVLSGLGYAYKTNPTYEEMRNELAERRQQMVLIPNSEHNPKSDADLAKRSLLLCQDRLHYYNLWFFSLLVKSHHDSKVRIFHSQDVNLQKYPWAEFYENIVDVGYLGKWHNLERNFIDFDLNTVELDQLPS